MYGPLIGDITLHFCKAGLESASDPSNSGSDSRKEVPGNSQNLQTEQGPQRDLFKSKDSKDNESQVKVKGITLGGCTLFPGSQVLIHNFHLKSSV